MCVCVCVESMEKSLGMMPEAEQTDAKVLGSLAMGDRDFSDRRLGLVDKIPLVKPYFKKKHAQRKLDTKCLRALEDPILSSILGPDGDGVFVPGAAAQPSLMMCAAAAVAEEARADATAEDERKATGASSDSVGSAAVMVSTRSSSSPSSALDAADKTANGAPSGVGHGELFRDKTDEASLDLVFELLMQLQYHTRQDDAVHICVDFLRGACLCGSECARHHTALPYHWQIRRADTRIWQSVAEDAQEQLERLYCNPDNEQVRLKFL